ncbi:hypothetical protein CYMTET_30404, partial [Cymbomonas tetramitiformis]
WESLTCSDDPSSVNAVRVGSGPGMHCLLAHFRRCALRFLEHCPPLLCTGNPGVSLQCLGMLLLSDVAAMRNAAARMLVVHCQVDHPAAALKRVAANRPDVRALLAGIGHVAVGWMMRSGATLRTSVALLERLWHLLHPLLAGVAALLPIGGHGPREVLLAGTDEDGTACTPRPAWWPLLQALLWWGAHGWKSGGLPQPARPIYSALFTALPAVWRCLAHTGGLFGDVRAPSSGWADGMEESTAALSLDLEIHDVVARSAAQVQQGGSDQSGCWEVLRWFLLCGAGPNGPLSAPWQVAVEALVRERDLAGLPPGALSPLEGTAALLLLPGSPLADAGRLRLAPLFPAVAPGNLAASTRSLLGNLPRRLPSALQGQPTKPATATSTSCPAESSKADSHTAAGADTSVDTIDLTLDEVSAAGASTPGGLQGESLYTPEVSHWDTGPPMDTSMRMPGSLTARVEQLLSGAPSAAGTASAATPPVRPGGFLSTPQFVHPANLPLAPKRQPATPLPAGRRAQSLKVLEEDSEMWDQWVGGALRASSATYPDKGQPSPPPLPEDEVKFVPPPKEAASWELMERAQQQQRGDPKALSRSLGSDSGPKPKGRLLAEARQMWKSARAGGPTAAEGSAASVSPPGAVESPFFRKPAPGTDDGTSILSTAPAVPNRAPSAPAVSNRAPSVSGKPSQALSGEGHKEARQAALSEFLYGGGSLRSPAAPFQPPRQSGSATQSASTIPPPQPPPLPQALKPTTPPAPTPAPPPPPAKPVVITATDDFDMPMQQARPMNVPRRVVIQLAGPIAGAAGGPGRRTDHQAGMRGAAAVRRTVPRLDHMYEAVLRWSLPEVAERRSGAPGMELLDAAGRFAARAAPAKGKLPRSFATADGYFGAFRPLVLTELRAALQQQIEQETLPPPLPAVLLEFRRQDKMTIAQFQVDQAPPESAVKEGDLAVLMQTPGRLGGGSKGQSILERALGSAQRGQQVHALVKVDAVERMPQQSALRIRARLCLAPEGPEDAPRMKALSELLMRLRGSAGDEGGEEPPPWELCKVMSMVPHLREMQALETAPQCPLFPTILSPSSQAAMPGDLEVAKAARHVLRTSVSPKLLVALQSHFNESQLAAIAAAVTPLGDGVEGSSGVTLVQGPPGTGKTTTLLAIVALLLQPAGNAGRDTREGGEAQQSGVAAAAQPDFPAGALPDGGGGCSEYNNMVLSALRQGRQKAMAAGGSPTQLPAPRKRPTKKKGPTRAPSAAGVEGEGRAEASGGPSEGNARPRMGMARQKVLICAQSNAAVDELLARIVQRGLYGPQGTLLQPNVVRIGQPAVVAAESKPYLLDELLEQHLADEAADTTRARAGGGLANSAGHGGRAAGGSAMELRNKLRELGEKVRQAGAAAAAARDPTGGEPGHARQGGGGNSIQLQARADMLRVQQRQLFNELTAAEGQERASRAEENQRRDEARRHVLRGAHLVLATLSGSGSDLLQGASASGTGKGRASRFAGAGGGALGKAKDRVEFDVVVIDEAAQALEPATLIPLQLLAPGGRCVLVGDPLQLPATVLSRDAAAHGLEQSLFERLQRAGHPTSLLEMQYRMHPAICAFPSRTFYESRICDGVTAQGRHQPFHREQRLGPLVFVNVADGRESSQGTSLRNPAEAEVATFLFSTLLSRYPKEAAGLRVGIVTPYKGQAGALRSALLRNHAAEVVDRVHISTVDGVQGQEFDVVLMSCVRANAVNNEGRADRARVALGFVTDSRRMNVALTRARCSLWVLGHAASLRHHPQWRALVDHCEAQGCLLQARRPYAQSLSSSRPGACILDDKDSADRANCGRGSKDGVARVDGSRGSRPDTDTGSDGLRSKGDTSKVGSGGRDDSRGASDPRAALKRPRACPTLPLDVNLEDGEIQPGSSPRSAGSCGAAAGWTRSVHAEPRVPQEMAAGAAAGTTTDCFPAEQGSRAEDRGHSTGVPGARSMQAPSAVAEGLRERRGQSPGRIDRPEEGSRGRHKGMGSKAGSGRVGGEGPVDKSGAGRVDKSGLGRRDRGEAGHATGAKRGDMKGAGRDETRGARQGDVTGASGTGQPGVRSQMTREGEGEMTGAGGRGGPDFRSGAAPHERGAAGRHDGGRPGVSSHRGIKQDASKRDGKEHSHSGGDTAQTLAAKASLSGEGGSGVTVAVSTKKEVKGCASISREGGRREAPTRCAGHSNVSPAPDGGGDSKPSDPGANRAGTSSQADSQACPPHISHFLRAKQDAPPGGGESQPSRGPGQGGRDKDILAGGAQAAAGVPPRPATKQVARQSAVSKAQAMPGEGNGNVAVRGYIAQAAGAKRARPKATEGTADPKGEDGHGTVGGVAAPHQVVKRTRGVACDRMGGGWKAAGAGVAGTPDVATLGMPRDGSQDGQPTDKGSLEGSDGPARTEVGAAERTMQRLPAISATARAGSGPAPTQPAAPGPTSRERKATPSGRMNNGARAGTTPKVAAVGDKGEGAGGRAAMEGTYSLRPEALPDATSNAGREEGGTEQIRGSSCEDPAGPHKRVANVDDAGHAGTTKVAGGSNVVRTTDACTGGASAPPCASGGDRPEDALQAVVNGATLHADGKAVAAAQGRRQKLAAGKSQPASLKRKAEALQGSRDAMPGVTPSGILSNGSSSVVQWVEGVAAPVQEEVIDLTSKKDAAQQKKEAAQYFHDQVAKIVRAKLQVGFAEGQLSRDGFKEVCKKTVERVMRAHRGDHAFLQTAQVDTYLDAPHRDRIAELALKCLQHYKEREGSEDAISKRQ